MLKLRIFIAISAVFGMVFIIQPSAQADSTHASARLFNNYGTTQLQFGISTIPVNIAYDIEHSFILSSPSCGGGTGSGIPAIACGSYAPNIRICSQVDGYNNTASGTLNVSVRCFSTLIARQFDGGGNLTQWNASRIINTTGYFSDTFVLFGDNYYTVNMDSDALTAEACKNYSTSSSCTYWVEYYNGTQYIPYAAVGQYNSVISTAYWTPAITSPTPSPSPTSIPEGNALFNTISGGLQTAFKGSILGQFYKVYEDFFSLCYNTHLDLARDYTGQCWKDVNPHTSYVNIGSLVLSDDQYHLGINGIKACKGYPVKMSTTSIVNHRKKVYNATTGEYSDGDYLNNFDVRNDLGTLPSAKVFYPFDACDGDVGYIADKIVRPITTGIVLIALIFTIGNVLFTAFGMNYAILQDIKEQYGNIKPFTWGRRQETSNELVVRDKE